MMNQRIPNNSRQPQIRPTTLHDISAGLSAARDCVAENFGPLLLPGIDGVRPCLNDDVRRAAKPTTASTTDDDGEHR